MEDGSAKCLLDVISDPAALNEFLRSNSQGAAIVEQNATPGKTDSLNTVANPTFIKRQLSTVTNTRSSIAECSHNTVVQAVSTTAIPVNAGSLGLNPSFQNGRTSVGHSVMQNMIRTVNTGVTSPSRTLTNQVCAGNTTIIQSNAKASVMTPVPFQGKKPIPIQPKNPVLLPGGNVSGGIHTNIIKGLQVVTPTVTAAPHQTQMSHPSLKLKNSTCVVINGVENVNQKGQNLGLSTKTHAPVNQKLLATPQKWIAPKQQVMPQSLNSPAIGSPSKVQNLIKMQPVITTPKNDLTQVVQHQLVNVVRQHQPQQQAIGQNPQVVVPKPAQHVQQIQQLVEQKLKSQQTQVQVQPEQQKVFTPAQLQAALKQTKLLTQSSGQQPSLQVQQQILKQLLLLQQTPSEKQQLPLSIQQLPDVQSAKQNVLQQLQQQVKFNSQQTVGHTKPNQATTSQQVGPVNSKINNLVNQSTVNHLSVANQVAVGNRPLVSQVITSNQPMTTSNNCTVSANQQQATEGKIMFSTNQQGIVINQLVNSKQQPMTLSQQGSAQSVIVVTQPQLVTQQNLVCSGAQLKAIVDQQQKQMQQILTQSRSLSQPVITSQVSKNNVGQSTIQGAINTNQIVAPKFQGQPLKQTSTPVSTTSQPVTTVQQLTLQQIQQLQNAGGIQKVLIIKQPELLQKQGTQGVKPQQTIHITTQQLQTLRQMQLQQQSPPQNSASVTQLVTGVQPKLLTTQQLKQLQLLQQQQSAAGNKIGQITTAQTLQQTQQSLIQKQALAQQLQKQLQTSKAQAKTSQLPRILQTSGRQPITSSQVSHVKSSIKQETSRGVKRAHPETPDTPKVVTRIKSALLQDQQSVLHPEIHKPFKSLADATSKLVHYHVYHEPDPTPKEMLAADALYNAVATQLVKRSEKMMEKYRQLILDESMRNEPSSEMVMLYRVFLADERAALAQEKLKAAEDLKALEEAALTRENDGTSKIAIANENCTLSSTPLITCTTTSLEIDSEETEGKTEDTSLSPLVVTIDNSLEDEEGLSDLEEPEESEVDKAVHNMESSTSSAFYMGFGNSSGTSLVVDSPSTNPSSPVGLECAEEMDLDDDGDKEDVTATLALLHSMAEELDDTIS